MGLKSKLFLVGFVIIFAVVYRQYREFSKPLEAAKLDLDFYWGPGDKSSHEENKEIISNRVLFDQDLINDLRKRLNNTDLLHEPLEGVNCEYGTNTKVLKKVIKYWRDQYLPKWRARELYIWSLPHLTTDIQGLKIHFIQTQVVSNPKNKKKYPLLLLHGWPGSVIELFNITKKLSIELNEEQKVLFEVVAPSIPGIGWSQAPAKQGFGSTEAAVLFHNLMLRLGYTKYFIQGGDWGSEIGSRIATLFPDAVLGYHANLCSTYMSPISNIKYLLASLYPSWFVDEKYQPFYFPISEKLSFMLEETGHMHLQATKPDTIGAALTDNPIGLASYILEKFSTWTNPAHRYEEECGIGKDFTMDQLLDNIMIYYLTNSVQTALRFYKENAKNSEYNFDRVPIDVRTGCLRTINGIAHSFDWQLQDKYTNIIHSKHYFEGGHFLAYENPELLYKDFLQFVYKVLKL